jgi:hypothetical protein
MDRQEVAHALPLSLVEVAVEAKPEAFANAGAFDLKRAARGQVLQEELRNGGPVGERNLAPEVHLPGPHPDDEVVTRPHRHD